MLRLLNVSALLGVLAFSCSDSEQTHQGVVPTVAIEAIPWSSIEREEEWKQRLQQSASNRASSESAVLASISVGESATALDLVRALREVGFEPGGRTSHPVLGIFQEQGRGVTVGLSGRQRAKWGIAAQPFVGTSRVAELGRSYVTWDSVEGIARIRVGEKTPFGNGHDGTAILVIESGWASMEEYPLKEYLLLLNLGQSGYPWPDIPVWLERSMPMEQAMRVFETFAEAGAKLIAVQTFSISDDPPSE